MAFKIIVGRNASDREKFGEEGTIFIGKSYVKMGRTTSLSNEVYMDVVRSHVVFVVGKRGSGKCLDGDTLVTLENGSRIPIKDFVDDNKKLFSLNGLEKVVSTKKEGFYKRRVNKMLKITLRSGKSIKLTPEHPLLTIEGWVQAQFLGINSRIATPRSLPIQSDNEMRRCEVLLLAYLLTEGHTKKAIHFSNYDSTIVEDFYKALLDFDKNYVLMNDKKGQFRVVRKDYSLNMQKKAKICREANEKFTDEDKKRNIRLFLEKHGLFGKLAIEKTMPTELFKLNNDQITLLLNRMFSCDGSIYKVNDYWEISYSSSSKRLAEDVQHLLLRFGILSKLRDKKVKCNGKMFDTYELVIGSTNVKHFILNIGFFGEKYKTSIKCLEETWDKIRNPNVDTIPKEIWKTYKPFNWAAVGRKMSYKHPKALRESKRYSPSRDKLAQISSYDTTAQSEIVYDLATSDIFWDEIVSTEELYGDFEVYDITVPKYHNFVANDIIVHNSYSAGVIAEGMVDLPEKVSKNLAIIMLDTMGIYWTMKYANEKDATILEEWGLTPKALEKVKIFTPIGQFKRARDLGIPTDFPFSINPAELSGEDWRLAFELGVSHPVSVVIDKTLGDFAEAKIDRYGIDDIVLRITQDDSFPQMVKNEAVNLFKAAKRWGLFSNEGTNVDVLIQSGHVSVLDVSAYTIGEGGWGVKSLVIGIIANRIFVQRMISRQLEELEAIRTGYSYFKMEEALESKDKKPLVWFILDEAHEMLPAEGKTAATDALVTILREGRQPGLSLLLITQQPGKIHSDVLTQSDIVLAHRLTAQRDVQALNSMMQSYLGDTLTGYLNVLPSEKGAAIILDDNSERLYPIQVRPKFSWHGGEAPTAIKYKKALKLGL